MTKLTGNFNLVMSGLIEVASVFVCHEGAWEWLQACGSVAACFSVCFCVIGGLRDRHLFCVRGSKMSFNNRAYQRTVVFLDKRLISIPNNTETSRLTNAWRVMDISFTKNNTAAEIGDILMRAFPPLAGKDLSLMFTSFRCVITLRIVVPIRSFSTKS